MPPEPATIYAALDLGTSRIRVGVFVERPSPAFVIVADRPNEVRIGNDGSARCDFAQQWRQVEELLRALGVWCREHRVERLHLGLCGQVSSLLRWDAAGDAPIGEDYPIWMDSTCRDSVGEFAKRWADGGAQADLGTCMLAATNWLAVKIHDHLAKGGAPALYLQVQDAVFLRLTGACLSHPSSQVSLVDQVTLTYSDPLLRFIGIGIGAAHLPRLDAAGAEPMRAKRQADFGLPPTVVHVGLQDTNAALHGMFAVDGDGLLLAGTSEIIGVYESAARPKPPARMVRTRLGSGWAIYGSSISGGSSVQWLMGTVLKRAGAGDLERLTDEAAALPPGADGLLCLPYLGGERAPLWDSRWSGAFIGLRAHHGDAHMFRALLEGVAMCRRQAAEALERPLPARFKMAGGGSANALWNRVRAAVLGRPIDVMSVADLSLLGSIRHAMEVSGRDDGALASLLSYQRVEPDPAWVAAYAEIYARFLRAQRALDPDSGTPAPRALATGEARG